eukprot:CAMPEP_0202967954 /NCGR_PEP_ID=MMETSP1396-20130829/13033_1 /ASSEMBLY_ACC=CAM_ASM_000872 /TAXON_ID= /ORGANISM="Pseudokeronopsis sp., Strain Brazil" /LENGTH=212 /DNA_ID=CAMNT_0049693657 /DNA_START=504 /DNA_END=1142 /DNA_ORIENTATION=+
MKEKKLVIHADGDNQFYPIDKIKRLKGFTTSKDTYYVQVKTKGDFRTVEIRSSFLRREGEACGRAGICCPWQDAAEKLPKDWFQEEYKFKGLGISIIDNEPKELIYFSLYKFEYIYEQLMEKKKKNIGGAEDEFYTETTTRQSVEIYHMQIDNMVSDELKVLFYPTRALKKSDLSLEHMRFQDDDYYPFVQVNIVQIEIKEKDFYAKKFQSL